MYTRVNFMRYSPLNFYLEVKSHATERADIHVYNIKSLDAGMPVIFHVSLKFRQANSARNTLKRLKSVFFTFRIVY
jgi:hypothetical protein